MDLNCIIVPRKICRTDIKNPTAADWKKCRTVIRALSDYPPPPPPQRKRKRTNGRGGGNRKQERREHTKQILLLAAGTQMRRRDEVVYRSSSNVVIDVDGRSNERGGGRRERDGRGRTRGKEAVVESRLGRGGGPARPSRGAASSDPTREGAGRVPGKRNESSSSGAVIDHQRADKDGVDDDDSGMAIAARGRRPADSEEISKRPTPPPPPATTANFGVKRYPYNAAEIAALGRRPANSEEMSKRPTPPPPPATTANFGVKRFPGGNGRPIKDSCESRRFKMLAYRVRLANQMKRRGMLEDYNDCEKVKTSSSITYQGSTLKRRALGSSSEPLLGPESIGGDTRGRASGGGGRQVGAVSSPPAGGAEDRRRRDPPAEEEGKSAAGVVAGDRVAVSPPPAAGVAVASSPGRTRGTSGGGASLPTPPPRSPTTTTVSSLADIARDVIARTEGGLLVAAAARDVEGLCGFLVAKYAVADIDVPARMSPSATVDAVWHSLMLHPRAYDSACRLAYELASRAVGTEGDHFAYDGFPGVVDHSPNAANDPPSAKEQRRRAAVFEMNCLGLSPSTTTAAPARLTRSRANVCTPPAAPSSKRARLTNGHGLGRDSAEEKADEAVEAEEDVAEEEEPEEDEANEEEANEEVRVRAGHAGDHMTTIRVCDHSGEVIWYKINRSTIFEKIMIAYALRKGVEAKSLAFLLDGEKIRPDDTCATLQLEDGDRVDVSLEQRGC